MAVSEPPSPQQMLLALFADEASALIWCTDHKHRVQQISGGALVTLGLSQDDPETGMSITKTFDQDPHQTSDLVSAHESTLNGDVTTCEFEWRGWHFRARVMPQLDDRGEVSGCVGIALLHATIDGLEEALDASERRFETLVGMSPAGIFMTDPQGHCTYANRRWCEMAGVVAADVLGAPWDRIVHPEDRTRVAKRWLRTSESGRPWELTFRLKAADNGTIWVLGQARPLYDGTEQVAGYVGIMIDITERKQTERRLQESEDRFSRLLSAVTSYRYRVTMRDGQPVATQHSDSCVGTTGYLPRDYLNDPYLWIKMVHPEDRDRVREQIGKVLAGQAVPPMEHRIFHKDGSIVWVRDTIIPYYSNNGDLVRYDGLVEDVTDRKQVERRLWQILESAPDAMVITDQEGTILLTNCQTQRLFGYTGEELLHQHVEMLIPERYRDSHIEHRNGYSEMLESREMTQRPDLHGRRKDGTEFAAEISLSPVEMDDQILVCAGIRDISHRRAAEQAVRANLHIQSTMANLLKLSLEPIALAEKLERSLELLFTIPWIELESKGAVFLASEGGEKLDMVAHRGLSPALLGKCQQIDFGHCLCGQAAASRQTVFAGHLDEHHVVRYAGIADHGHYCVPITSGSELFGVLNLYVSSGHNQSDEQRRFLEAVAHILAGIIQRSRAEESLRSSEERFNLATRGTDAGIWDWNLLTDQVYFSPRWKGILGFASDEIGNRLPEWNDRIHPEDQARARATVEAYLAGQVEQYELEHRLRHRDGTYRWILARGAMVRGADGRPCRMVGSHLDITDRKMAEEKLRLQEAQLIAAQKIQEHLLPRKAPMLPGYDIAGRVTPAQFAAGDHFDYLTLADGTFAVCVGDVSGHDVSAALVMASTCAHLRSFAVDHSQVQEIVEHTNEVLSRETDDGLFVTMFVMQLDFQAGTFRYVNAGHPHGYLLDSSGQVKATMRSTSFPLAVLPDAEYPISELMTIDPGDMVLLITDGILEARALDDSCFCESRLLDVVRENCHRPAALIVAAIHAAVQKFTGLEHMQDDLTAVVVKYAP